MNSRRRTGKSRDYRYGSTVTGGWHRYRYRQYADSLPPTRPPKALHTAATSAPCVPVPVMSTATPPAPGTPAVDTDHGTVGHHGAPELACCCTITSCVVAVEMVAMTMMATVVAVISPSALSTRDATAPAVGQDYHQHREESAADSDSEAKVLRSRLVAAAGAAWEE